MKKKLMIALIISLAVATGAFAFKGGGFAFGAEATSTNLSSYGGMITLRVPAVPLHFAVGGYADNGHIGMDVVADYWLLHGSFVKGFDWYMGIGGYFGLQMYPDTDFSLGARIPCALQVWPMGELMEIFLEMAPAWIPITGSGPTWTNFCVQLGMGVRIWF